VLPDDGPMGPEHVGIILKVILICVEGFKVYKFLKQYTGPNGFIICLSRTIARYRNKNYVRTCYSER